MSYSFFLAVDLFSKFLGGWKGVEQERESVVLMGEWHSTRVFIVVSSGVVCTTSDERGIERDVQRGVVVFKGVVRFHQVLYYVR